MFHKVMYPQLKSNLLEYRFLDHFAVMHICFFPFDSSLGDLMVVVETQVLYLLYNRDKLIFNFSVKASVSYHLTSCLLKYFALATDIDSAEGNFIMMRPKC